MNLINCHMDAYFSISLLDFKIECEEASQVYQNMKHLLSHQTDHMGDLHVAMPLNVLVPLSCKTVVAS